MRFVPLVEAPRDALSGDRWYVVRQGEILVDEDGRLPDDAAWAIDRGDSPLLLGLSDGEPCWAVGVPAGTPERDGTRWAPLLALGAEWDDDEWSLAGRAVQLVEWQRTSRYCGRCAHPTEGAPGERAMRCPACGLLAYPRLAPAVIVLVRRGAEALLAQGRGFRGRMYSTLAGFVEPGETLEEAVRREVGEEVGVSVGEVRYFASQPWPFPHSLMIGFLADWANGEIEVDGVEIVDAGWYRADRLPTVPPRLSIARRLIDDWVSEVTGAPLALP